MTMDSRVRMAVVGAGSFGALHARTLSGLPDVELVALVDENVARAQEIASGLGIEKVFKSLPELIAARIADAVIIATRTDTHLPLAAAALEAGLHAFVEKPLARSPEEIRAFQARFADSPRVLMVDHLCLFHSLIVPMMERIRAAGFRALHFVRHRPDSIGAYHPEEHPIRLTMVHDLYVAAQLAGGEEPVGFHAMDARNKEGRVDMTWASLRWKDGRTATFHCHMMLPEGSPSEGWDYLEAYGENYHSRVTTNPAPWVWTEEKATHPVALEISENHGDPTGMLAAILKRFAAACRGEAVPHGCRAEDALQVQAWIERLIQIAQENS